VTLNDSHGRSRSLLWRTKVGHNILVTTLEVQTQEHVEHPGGAYISGDALRNIAADLSKTFA